MLPGIWSKSEKIIIVLWFYDLFFQVFRRDGGKLPDDLEDSVTSTLMDLHDKMPTRSVDNAGKLFGEHDGIASGSSSSSSFF